MSAHGAWGERHAVKAELQAKERGKRSHSSVEQGCRSIRRPKSQEARGCLTAGHCGSAPNSARRAGGARSAKTRARSRRRRGCAAACAARGCGRRGGARGGRRARAACRGEEGSSAGWAEARANPRGEMAAPGRCVRLVKTRGGTQGRARRAAKCADREQPP